jgi:predicted  nucleic acid-binding Zn-ribbon protein
VEKLSERKKATIIRQYLYGLSYDEIAGRSHVSKGTVSNVIADLKAGIFPEAADVGEHIELLRDLSFDLKRSKLTPEQCAAGLLVLTRLHECGLDPADIDRWPLILKSMGNEDEAQEFIRLVYSIEEVQRRTGLSLEDLQKKTHELERKAADLEPVAGKLKECKKQLAELGKQRQELASAVAVLEQKYGLLSPRVKDLERREQTLSHRIVDLEPKAQKAETTLTAVKGEIQKLDDIGLPLKELAEFNDRLQVIAQRHAIEPAELRSRLMHELETLDKGLTLEALAQSRQQELDKTELAIAKAKKELEVVKGLVGNLNREKANLEASIRETRERVGREIAKIIPVAQDTVDRLAKELGRGVNEALAEVHRFRDGAVEVGRELGRNEGILQVNEWLNELLALVTGEESVADKRVRAMGLLVLRGMAAWLKHYETYNGRLSTILFTANSLIKELEQWRV